MRSLALARRVARRFGGIHRLLVNTPWTRTLRQAVDDDRVEILALPPETSPAEARRWVLDVVESYQPNLLVVDTFPRGVGGEFKDFLAEWRGGFRVWTHRGLPERYVREFDLESWVDAAFDLILAPEGRAWPGGARRVPCVETAPWMVRGLDELWTPEAAARRLGCEPDERCELYVGTGTSAECADWIDRFRRALGAWRPGDRPLRLALPLEVPAPLDLPTSCIVRHSPLVELFPAVGRIVGNAGFHLVHEARWLGIPATWIARPRRYDDQQRRLDELAPHEGGAGIACDGTDQAVEALARGIFVGCRHAGRDRS